MTMAPGASGQRSLCQPVRLLLLVMICLLPSAASAQKLKRSPDQAQLQALHQLNTVSSRPDWRVRFTREGSTPAFLAGGRYQAVSADPAEAGREFLDRARGVFRIRDAGREFEPRAVAREADGSFHVRMDQRVGALPVFGAQLIVHGEADGAIWMANGQYYPHSEEAPSSPVLSAEQARSQAISELNLAGALPDSTALGYYPLGDSLRLAYRLALVPGPGSERLYAVIAYVDAVTGELLDSYNNLKTQGLERATTGIGYGTREIVRPLRSLPLPHRGRWVCRDQEDGSAQVNLVHSGFLQAVDRDRA